MKVAIPLAKNVLTAATSAIAAGIQKKMHDSWTRILIISNEEMNDIIKSIQSLEDFNILLKGVAKTIKNETKKTKRRIFKYAIRYFIAILLVNLLAGKRIVRAGSGNKKEKGIVRAGTGKQWDF